MLYSIVRVTYILKKLKKKKAKTTGVSRSQGDGSVYNEVTMQAHKGLSSDLYHPHKNLDMVVALICNSRSGKAEAGGSLGPATQLV